MCIRDRAGSVHGLGKFTGKADVWHAGFAPHQVGVGSVGNTAADGLFQAVLDAVETFLRALTGQEWLVVGVVVAGDQVGSFCVGAGPVSYTHLDVYKRQPRI